MFILVWRGHTNILVGMALAIPAIPLPPPLDNFSISVGVHQGSALSPFLFVVVMDTITRDLQQSIPWTLL